MDPEPAASALIFGPGLPPAGARGTVRVSAIGVEAAAGDVSLRAPLADVRLRSVGFDERGLELSWNSGDATWAVHVLDGDAARRLLSTSALASGPAAVALGSRRRTAAHWLGWSVLAAFILLPVVLLLVFVANSSRIAGWLADRIPIEQEVAIGRQAFAGMRGALTLQSSGAAREAVNAIGARLTKGSRFTYEFHVAEDPSLNAFALPGGVIVVNTGLIAATRRPEELAGVLAHEVQHVELRHSIRGMVKDLGLRGLFAFATGDLGGSLLGEAAVGLASLKFSRDDESQADQAAFDALSAAEIDPSGLPAFFAIMHKQGSDAPAAFVSTHPLSADREAALRARLSAGTKASTPLRFDPWPPR
jgi:Zn-dependent protease with chaperone function